jgi:hypothetical protein
MHVLFCETTQRHAVVRRYEACTLIAAYDAPLLATPASITCISTLLARATMGERLMAKLNYEQLAVAALDALLAGGLEVTQHYHDPDPI